MNTLQSNIEYLTNKVEDNSIDKITSEDFFKYDQDVISTQGILQIIFIVFFWNIYI